jgi:hypothetical protein
MISINLTTPNMVSFILIDAMHIDSALPLSNNKSFLIFWTITDAFFTVFISHG